MHATPLQVYQMIVDVLQMDAPALVRRQDVTRRVRDRLHSERSWEAADDEPSRSPNGHSLGEATIDWRITGCAKLA